MFDLFITIGLFIPALGTFYLPMIGASGLANIGLSLMWLGMMPLLEGVFENPVAALCAEVEPMN